MEEHPPRVSFITPAYNEAKLIGSTLEALREAADSLDLNAELIVVDDGSTDRTSQVAANAGARLVQADHRQIAAARNTGARSAQGDILIFVDADTNVPTQTIHQALNALDEGAIGGGAPLRFTESAPLPAHAAVWSWNRTSYRMSWAAGSFLFVRRQAFEAVGGFDETYFASEELHLSRALKARGALTIVNHPVYTSARKLRLYSMWAHFKILANYLRTRGRNMHQRETLSLWYDGSRET